MRLQRDDQNASRTYGVLSDADEGGTLQLQTLERPWLNDAADVSCVAAGAYVCPLEYSTHHDCALYVIPDPKRTMCEFHVANIVQQLKGCAAVGLDRAPSMRIPDYPVGDGVKHSLTALRQLMANRGVPNFEALTSEFLVAQFVKAHPAAATMRLVIVDPSAAA